MLQHIIELSLWCVIMYSFPILNPSEIYNHLTRSLEIPLHSEDELTRPQPGTIREIYVRLLEFCLNKPREELFKQSHSEFHESAAFNVLLFKQTGYFLSTIGCADEQLKIQDLLFPEFKRHRKFLSAFLNYIKFMVEEQELLYDTEKGEIITRISASDFARTKEEYERVSNEVAALKRKKAEQGPFVQEKLSVLEKLNEEIAILEDERGSLEFQVRELETEINGCEEAKRHISEQDKQIGVKLARVQEEIVSSPEKTIERLNSLKSQFELENESFQQEQENLREVCGKLESIENIISIVKQANLLLANCTISMEKCKELKKTASASKNQLLELEYERKSKQLQNEALSREEQEYQERVARKNQTLENKIGVLGSALQQKENENAALNNEIRELENKLAEVEGTYRELEGDFENKKTAERDELQRLETEHSEIVQKVEWYKLQLDEMFQRRSIVNPFRNHFSP